MTVRPDVRASLAAGLAHEPSFRIGALTPSSFRCAQNNQETGPGGIAEAAQAVKRLDDRSIATEENAGVVGFVRSQAAVGWAVRITFRRPREETRIKAGAL